MKHRKVYSPILHAKGFTLVELLVATAILSVAMAAIYTSFSAGVQVWKEGEKGMQAYQEARLALQIMSREIRSISAAYWLYDTIPERWSTFDPDNPDKTEKFIGLLGDTGDEPGGMPRLRFVTHSPSLFTSENGTTSDLLIVQYSLGKDRVSGTFRLERRELLIGEMKKDDGEVEQKDPIVLAENLEGLDLEYHWPARFSWPGGWLGHCRPRFFLPDRIMITLRAKSESPAGARSFRVGVPVRFSFRDDAVGDLRYPPSLRG